MTSHSDDDRCRHRLSLLASGLPTHGTTVTAPLLSTCTDQTSDAREGDDDYVTGDTSQDDSEAKQPEAEQSYSDWARQAADELMALRRRTAAARGSGTAAAPHGVRRHDISRVPQPWGMAPQQDALRGVITAYDSDGRCSYGATHKCHSTHNHWSRCLVVDHPEDAEFWGDVTEQYTSARTRESLVDLVRCERCAVGIHPACAVDYSEWSGKVGEPGGYYDRRDILRGNLLCCKCFDDHLPYVWADDPDHNPDFDHREVREGELPWWITDVDLPPHSESPPELHSPSPPPSGATPFSTSSPTGPPPC